MRQPQQDEHDAEVLPEQVASRLLTRASELDAAQRAGAAVAELRAAATEAGISPAAFDAALSELHAGQARVPDVSRKRRRPLRFVAIFAALITFGAFYVARRAVPVSSAPIVVEESFLLRCLTPADAAVLVRPLLPLPTNTVVFSPDRAPNVLTIRATPEQLRNVRSLLDRQESARASACTTQPAPAPTP